MAKTATYAEIAEKLTKKLGILEEDIKSTEPDIRNSAERTMPRIKAALAELQEGNDVARFMEEAKGKKGMLAKGIKEMPLPQEQGMPMAYGGKVPSYGNGSPLGAEVDLTGGQSPYAEAGINPWAQGIKTIGEGALAPPGGGNGNPLGKEVDLTGGQGPYDATGINPWSQGIETIGETSLDPPGGGNVPPPAPPEEEGGNQTIKNLYDMAKSAMVTAPFGYDYGDTQYYNPVYNQAEGQAMGNIADMRNQLQKAEGLAMQDSSIKTKDQEMAIEKARQQNLKASQNMTGAGRFGAQQMSNANAKDNLMQVFGQRDRQESMMNDPKRKAQLLAGMLPQYGSMAQMQAGIGGDRAGQDRYAQEHGLKTDAAMNALEMGKLSNMSKWAQMQKLMGNKENMDNKNFQAMMNMFGDPAVMEMYKKIGG